MPVIAMILMGAAAPALDAPARPRARRAPEVRPEAAARRLAAAGRFDAAVEAWMKAVTSRPRDRALWWELIDAFASRGRREEVVVWLDAFLKEFPDDPGAVDRLVDVLEGLGRREAAEEVLVDHLKRNPGDEPRAARRMRALLEARLYRAAAGFAGPWLEGRPRDLSWLDAAEEAEAGLGRGLDRDGWRGAGSRPARRACAGSRRRD